MRIDPQDLTILRNKEGQTESYAQLTEGKTLASDVDIVEGYAINGPATVAKKVQFARKEKLAGVMIWELGQDASSVNSLLKAPARSGALVSKSSRLNLSRSKTVKLLSQTTCRDCLVAKLTSSIHQELHHRLAHFEADVHVGPGVAVVVAVARAAHA